MKIAMSAVRSVHAATFKLMDGTVKELEQMHRDMRNLSNLFDAQAYNPARPLGVLLRKDTGALTKQEVLDAVAATKKAVEAFFVGELFPTLDKEYSKVIADPNWLRNLLKKSGPLGVYEYYRKEGPPFPKRFADKLIHTMDLHDALTDLAAHVGDYA